MVSEERSIELFPQESTDAVGYKGYRDDFEGGHPSGIVTTAGTDRRSESHGVSGI
ncbi:unknown [Clostridium sp. CAG:75]|nr:unknown [Clostridium sp. CAG:75]